VSEDDDKGAGPAAETPSAPTRRGFLLKLGLAVGTAYAAPLVMRLGDEAQAGGWQPSFRPPSYGGHYAKPPSYSPSKPAPQPVSKKKQGKAPKPPKAPKPSKHSKGGKVP
jgi:hypothetical protein